MTTRQTNLVVRLPEIARWLQCRGRFGRRLAFWMMRGRCSVCGAPVPGWKPGDFYACTEHLEQVRERWIAAVGYAAAKGSSACLAIASAALLLRLALIIAAQYGGL